MTTAPVDAVQPCGADDAPVKEATARQLRAALDGVVAESLKPVTLWVSLLFVALAISHSILLPPSARATMTGAAALTAVLLLGLYLVLRRSTLPPDLAHPIAAGATLLPLANSLLHLYLLGDPVQTTNVALVVIGVGCFFLSARWLALILSLAVGGWAAVDWLEGGASAWLHFGFMLLFSAVLSVIVHAVRVRTHCRLEKLNIADRARRRELERALGAEASAREGLERAVRERTAELRQSEAQYRLIFESNPLPMWVYDQQTLRFLAVNEAAVRHYGYSLEEFLAMTIKDIRPPEDVQTLSRYIEENPRGLHAAGVWRHLRKCGEVIDVEITAHPLTFGGREGELILANDVTERRRAEEALRESEERFRLLVEGVSDYAIFVLDTAGRVVSWNAGAEHVMGYAADEIIGEHCSRFFTPGEVGGGKPESVLRAAEEEGGHHEEGWRVRKGGADFWAEVLTTPLRDGLGRLRGFAKVTRDVTERKRLEAERTQLLVSEMRAREEAERANRMKDEFLAVLSHELRTPLTPIIGWTAMIRAGQIDGANLDGALESIERSARSQGRLIDDLLDVSRIASGKLQLDFRPVHVAPLIEAAVAAARPSAEAKGVRVETALDPQAGFVSGDRERLRQVVSNLLTNAVKFTPDGGRVEVRLVRNGPHAEMTIADTGHGISPDFLPHVFDRFRQADSSTTRRHGGLGLGLSIVRDLVEMHGGTITAESPGEGHGATFIIRLPVVTAGAWPGDVERRRAVSEVEAGPYAPPSLSGLRVLAVDDEPNTRELLSAVLRQYGAEARVAASAGEALEVFGSWRPDVLVADIEMPGEDGYSLIGRVRALAEGAGGRTPAVALTAYARAEDRMRALLAGYQVHVPKPVAPGELAAVVAGLAGRKATSED